MNDPEVDACANALAADPAYGAMVVPIVYAGPRRRARAVLRRSRAPTWQAGRIAWLTDWLEGPGSKEMERDPSVVLFRSMDRAFATMAAWRRAERRAAAARTWCRPAAGRGGRVLGAAGPVLAEREAKSLLAATEFPWCKSAREQRGRGRREPHGTGRQRRCKIESPDIPHKTEAGVIRLGGAEERGTRGLHGGPGERRAWRALHHRGAGAANDPEGIEMIVGARIDRMFGPIVVVGLGGILVELPARYRYRASAGDAARGAGDAGGPQGGRDVPRFPRRTAGRCRRLADIVRVGASSRTSGRDGGTGRQSADRDGGRIVAVDALIVQTPSPGEGLPCVPGGGTPSN